jgi:hypothetical protein
MTTNRISTESENEKVFSEIDGCYTDEIPDVKGDLV